MSIDLEFAKKIGATHWRKSVNNYYKVIDGEAFYYYEFKKNAVWSKSRHSLGLLMRELEEIKYQQDQPKGHKHADLAIQYWIEAKEDAEAWRNWQTRGFDGELVDCDDHPMFLDNAEYRRKPKVKLVHGFEVHDISFVPSSNDEPFYAPCPARPPLMFFDCPLGSYNELRIHFSMLNACYPHTEEGKQAAIKHALAMWGFGSMEEYKNAMGEVK